MLDPAAVATEALLVTHTTTSEGTATMSTSTLAYSSSTDAGTTYLAPEFDAPEPTYADPWADLEYCFVCGRATDHVGEHEDLVAAGLAEYDGFTVVRTNAWDADLAATIGAAGYTAYLAGPVAYEAFCQGLEGARS